MAKSSAKKPSRVKTAPLKKVAASQGRAKTQPRLSAKPARKPAPPVKSKKPLAVGKSAKASAKQLKKSKSIPLVVKSKTAIKAKLVAKAKPAIKAKAGPTATQAKVSGKIVSVPKPKLGKAIVKTALVLKSASPVKPVIASKAKNSLAKVTHPAKPAVLARQSPSAQRMPTKSARHVAAPVQVKPEPFQHGPAVATNLKPRKSQVGLTVKELEHFADLLLEKRRELVGDMSSMEREALRSGSYSNLSTLPIHMADMGTDNYEQEFTLGLVEKDRNLLREINNALGKIQNGTFGICEGTGLPVSKARLEAQPWARYSIEYARQRERNGMGVRTL